MRTVSVKVILLMVLLGLPLSCGGGGGSIQPPPKGAASYYLDCSAATNGNGTQGSPWNTLSSTNGISFGPGDQLLEPGRKTGGNTGDGENRGQTGRSPISIRRNT